MVMCWEMWFSSRNHSKHFDNTTHYYHIAVMFSSCCTPFWAVYAWLSINISPNINSKCIILSAPRAYMRFHSGFLLSPKQTRCVGCKVAVAWVLSDFRRQVKCYERRQINYVLIHRLSMGWHWPVSQKNYYLPDWVRDIFQNPLAGNSLFLHSGVKS